MQHLDVQVTEQALDWLREGETVWFCTVLSTFGSSPREPGSLFVARADGRHAGSLSGGCVEEDFLERLRAGAFNQTVEQIRYGSEDGFAGARVSLPCGGILNVLIERLKPEEHNLQHMETLRASLRGQQGGVRRVALDTGEKTFLDDDRPGPRVTEDNAQRCVFIRVGPAARLIIAGVSPVSVACAEFAKALGYEVILCDPREEAFADLHLDGVTLEPILPSLYIATPGHCHGATAIVALTHDPRIDDLAMIEAVVTPAFYIGVMGSRRTSKARAERLSRSGGLTEQQIARIQMPIGLALGSKTPAEIALAVMADILRVRRGREREAL
ncbi:XdhC family protein [Marinimicrobium agarilyticum]|uniref:XdhC family protein n=1 Tax=Marinimicrobium agarilyticum TaxID=306546 RepID=UPI0003FF050A|nr:XdhC family protein [Marinimicrobium agarilyticum]